MGYKKGQSGNPAGKASGSGKIQPLRDALMLSVPAIIDSLTSAALAGDIQASKLLLERVFPALKPTEQVITLPLSGTALTDRGEAVIAAIHAGEISPSTAHIVLNALLSQAKLVEQGELVTRINDLEIMMREIRGK